MIRNIKYLLLTLFLTLSLTLTAHAQTGFAISETSEFSENTETSELSQQTVTTAQPHQKPTTALKDCIFPDGKEVTINTDVSCLKLVCEGVDIAKEFLKTARMPEKVYYEDYDKIKTNKGNPNDNNIHAPPIVTGTLEAGCKAVTDITSFVGFAYDMVFDSDARTEAWEGMKGIATEIGNDVSQILPLLSDIVLEEVTGANAEEYRSLLDSETDNGAKINIATRSSEQTLASIFMGGSFFNKLPDVAAKLSAKMALAKGWKSIKAGTNGVADELVQNLKKKLGELPTEDCKRFLDDFADASKETIEKFLEKPELVYLWKKVNALNNPKAMLAWKKHLANDFKDMPTPEEIFGAEFVAKHLAKFEDGVSCLKLESVKRYPNLGMDDGLFVLPKSEMNALLERTGGDISKIEKELGIPEKGGWSEQIKKGDKLIRIDIDNSQINNLRMPIGTESTANDLWIPGGRTSNGQIEAVIDAIPWNKINSKQVKVIVGK